TAKNARPSASENSGRNHLDLVIDMEHLLHGNAEETGEGERERERRRVLAGLDRVDRLPRDAELRAERPLRERALDSEVADVVAHRGRPFLSSCQVSFTSRLTRRDDLSQACLTPEGEKRGAPATGEGGHDAPLAFVVPATALVSPWSRRPRGCARRQATPVPT